MHWDLMGWVIVLVYCLFPPAAWVGVVLLGRQSIRRFREGKWDVGVILGLVILLLTIPLAWFTIIVIGMFFHPQ